MWWILLTACETPVTKTPPGPRDPDTVAWASQPSTGLPAYVGSTRPIAAMASVVDQLFVALGDLGLHQSGDGGGSFVASPLSTADCEPLGLYVTLEDRLLVSCYSDDGSGGLWASDDGISFTPSDEGLHAGNEYDAQFVELNGRLYYDAAVVSDDGGRSWSTESGAPTGCRVYRLGDQLFCHRNAVADAHTWTSADDGLTWTDVTDASTSDLVLLRFAEVDGRVWALDNREGAAGISASVVSSPDGTIWTREPNLPEQSPVFWTLLTNVDGVGLISLGPDSMDGIADNGPLFFSRGGAWLPAVGPEASELAGAHAAAGTETGVLLLTEAGLISALWEEFATD